MWEGVDRNARDPRSNIDKVLVSLPFVGGSGSKRRRYRGTFQEVCVSLPFVGGSGSKHFISYFFPLKYLTVSLPFVGGSGSKRGVSGGPPQGVRVSLPFVGGSGSKHGAKTMGFRFSSSLPSLCGREWIETSSSMSWISPLNRVSLPFVGGSGSKRISSAAPTIGFRVSLPFVGGSGSKQSLKINS